MSLNFSLRLTVVLLACFGFATAACGAESLWLTDFEAAKERAKTERKLMLVVFVGSDWCPASMLIKEEYFDKEAFKAAVRNRFVPVELDFPGTFELPAALKKQNEELRARYNVNGFPTTYLLDATGNVCGRLPFLIGGVEINLRRLDEVMSAHEKVTALKSKAAAVDGLERARLLEEVIRGYEKLWMEQAEVTRVAREIIALDPDDKAGLKTKYTNRMIADAQKLLDERKVGEGLALLRSVVGENHPLVVVAHRKLAGVYAGRKDYSYSRFLYQRVLDLEKELIGDKQLVIADDLRDLARADAALGDTLKARANFEAALALKKELLGPQHKDLTELLEALGNNRSDKHEYAAAVPYFRESLAIRSKTFGEKSLEAAAIRNRLGLLLSAVGDYDEAKLHYEHALATRRERLGPVHPDTANSVGNLAGLLIDRREYDAAVKGLLEGVELRYALSEQVFASSSEAESLLFVKRNELIMDRLISEWRHIDRPIGDLYEQLWKGRGAVFQLAADRRRIVEFSLATTGDASQVYQAWLETRREVARLSLSPAVDHDYLIKSRRDQLQKATDRKEGLERQLMSRLPEASRKQALRSRPHIDLARVLPADSCFVDVIRYTRFDQNPDVPGAKGRKWTPSYSAFVMLPNRSVERIDFGPAAPIEAAAKAWRSAIISGGATTADHDLRRLVWEPLRKSLPSDVKTIYLVPDGPLTSIPWSALPGDKPDTVLLEDYALSIVPSGRMLLNQLESPTPMSDEGALLAVGGVQYGVEPNQLKPNQLAPLSQIASVRAATIDENRSIYWPQLPETLNEVVELEKLCGDRPLIKLTGREAGTARIVAELPKARWATFATHGFFADPAMRSAMQLDEASFRETLRNDREGVVSRNPLLLSGLVFAGANLPRAIDTAGVPNGDGGILTAEAIAGLPLSKLELAVLSACETGLGEVAGGEGTFGLQRAFHVAGCRNVVASLWKVDDEATAALMRLFYANIWHRKQPPLEALRNAQLTILRDPSEIKSSALRGLGVAKPLPNGGKPLKPDVPDRTGIRRWAAFQLSGAGN